MEEIWKTITLDIDFECTNKTRYEISNLGRIRSFNKIAQGRILKGSLREGYPSIAIKLFKVRAPEKEAEFQDYEVEIGQMIQRHRALVYAGEYPPKIIRLASRIEQKKEHLRKLKKKDFKRRTVNLTLLIHRVVADYFLPLPKPQETVISHLDYNKLNNCVDNLQWMTPEDNRKHQFNSPYVIAEKRQRKYNIKYRKRKKAWKLTSTQVMRIKMQLQRERPVRLIAKEFEVSETHIRRIKSGENWGHIKVKKASTN